MSKQRLVISLAGGLLLSAGLLTAAEPPAAPAAPSSPRVMVFSSRTTAGTFLGLGTLPMSPELRTHFGAPKERGLLVDKVEPGSAAAVAGVQVGDVLTAVGNEPVADSGELRRLVRGHEPGAKVRLSLVREKRPLTLEAKLGETRNRPEQVRVEHLTRNLEEISPDESPEGCFGVPIDAAWAERIAEEIERGLNRPEIRESLRVFEQRRPQLEERLRELEARLAEMEKRLRAAEKER